MYRRARALVLLAQGRTLEEIAIMAHKRYHPNRGLDDVRSAYLSKGGPFSLVRFEGKSRQEIKVGFNRMQRIAKSKRAILQRLWEDPAFASTVAEGARARITALNTDEEFRNAQLKSLMALHSNPDFARKRDERARSRINAINSDPAHQARALAQLEAINSDPENRRQAGIRGAAALAELRNQSWFVEKQAAAAGATMRRLHSDPRFIAWRDANITALNNDPEFTANRIAGIKRFWGAYRANKADMFQYSRAGHDEGTPVPIEPTSTEEQVDLMLSREAILEALMKLEPLHRVIVAECFGFEIRPPPELIFMAAHLTDSERQEIMERSFKILRGNERLRRFADELFS